MSKPFWMYVQHKTISCRLMQLQSQKVTDVCKVLISYFMSNWEAAATILLKFNETLSLFKENLILS